MGRRLRRLQRLGVEPAAGRQGPGETLAGTGHEVAGTTDRRTAGVEERPLRGGGVGGDHDVVPPGIARTSRAGQSSIASSRVRMPGRRACTSTAMLPGLCSLRIIFWWARGMSAQEKTSLMQGST